MHTNAAISFKPSSSGLFSLNPGIFQNPSFVIRPLRNKLRYSILNCRGVEIPFPKLRPSINSVNNGSTSIAAAVKDVDIATLGNLCVDIVLNVPELPPKPLEQRKAYLEQLSKSPPDTVRLFLLNYRLIIEYFVFSCYRYLLVSVYTEYSFLVFANLLDASAETKCSFGFIYTQLIQCTIKLFVVLITPKAQKILGYEWLMLM